MEFAINNSVHASTGETPFYINGLRHPRTPVSFVRSPSLSGGGPLTKLDAHVEERNGFAENTAETCSSDPAGIAVDTTPEGVSEESQHDIPEIFDDNDASLFAAMTHDRPLGGVIGERDAKSVSKAQRFVNERLAITRKVRDAMASPRDKQKQYVDQHGRKNNECFRQSTIQY